MGNTNFSSNLAPLDVVINYEKHHQVPLLEFALHEAQQCIEKSLYGIKVLVQKGFLLLTYSGGWLAILGHELLTKCQWGNLYKDFFTLICILGMLYYGTLISFILSWVTPRNTWTGYFEPTLSLHEKSLQFDYATYRYKMCRNLQIRLQNNKNIAQDLQQKLSFAITWACLGLNKNPVAELLFRFINRNHRGI